MSRRPAFELTELFRAIGPHAASLTREGRIALLGEAARDLLAGRLPAPEARLFLGGALLGWLTEAGNLERDYFKVTRPKSHDTVQRVWARHIYEGDLGRDELGLPHDPTRDTK